jgi:tetratricopeptide (TPR) repeat protein
MKRWFKRLIRSLTGQTKVVRSKGHFRNLADAARGRGDWDTAGRYYALHLEEDPQDFGIWVQLGHALKEAGLRDQADLAYGQASRLDDKNAELWLHRAHLGKIRQDFAAARHWFTLSYALEANPEVARELNALEGWNPGRSPTSAFGEGASRVLGALEIYTGAVVDIWAADPGAPEAKAHVRTAGSTDALKALEDENDRLKKLLATSMLDVAAMKDLVGQH